MGGAAGGAQVRGELEEAGGVMEGAVHSERKVYPVTAAEYQLLEEIGQGASAIVYRGMCLPHKEVVAIKALDLEKCNSNLVRALSSADLGVLLCVVVFVVCGWNSGGGCGRCI